VLFDSKPPTRENPRKAPYPNATKATRAEINQDYAITTMVAVKMAL